MGENVNLICALDAIAQGQAGNPLPFSDNASELDPVKLRGFDCNAQREDCRTRRCQKLEESRTLFCTVRDNITKDPGGGTCLERDTSRSIAKEYCKVGDRIKTVSLCNETYLGNFYTELAEAYCKGAGKSEQWCSCYNVVNKVCDTDSNAAGCADKALHFDTLVASTPDEFKSAWQGRESCFGGVCKGNKYIVPNANQGCDAPIKICNQDIEVSGISESTIDASCNLNDAGPGESDSGGGGEGKIFGFSGDTVIKGGIFTGGAFSFSCIICIIILVVVMSAGSKSRRYRR